MNREVSRSEYLWGEGSEWTIRSRKLWQFTTSGEYYLMQKDVLGLDVSVDDVAIMHKLNGVADLSYHCADPFLMKSSLFPQVGVDIAPATGFQD